MIEVKPKELLGDILLPWSRDDALEARLRDGRRVIIQWSPDVGRARSAKGWCRIPEEDVMAEVDADCDLQVWRGVWH